MKIDYSLLWIIPILALAYLGPINTGYEEIKWSAILCSFVILFSIHIIGYNLRSFSALFCVVHLITFPVSVFANLIFEISVRPDLWIETHYAMYACSVGILAFAMGSKVLNMNWIKPLKVYSAPYSNTTFNILLVLLIIPGAILKFKLGMYYHGSEGRFSFENVNYQNFISYIIRIAYLGIVLQVWRYLYLKSAKDGIIILILLFINILVFLPSGNRSATIGVLFPLLLYYLSHQKEMKRLSIRNIVIIGFSFYIIFLFIGIMGVSRGQGKGHTFEERYQIYTKGFKNKDVNSEKRKDVVVGRFSDYVAAGRIVAQTPSVFKFRGFQDVEKWWQIVLPGFLRKELGSKAFFFIDGSVQTYRYKVSVGGSTPITLIGDFYSRFGWLGIIFGMFFFAGFINILNNLTKDNSLFETLLFFTLISSVIAFVTASIFNTFTFFARDLFVTIIMAYFMTKIASIKFEFK